MIDLKSSTQALLAEKIKNNKRMKQKTTTFWNSLYELVTDTKHKRVASIFKRFGGGGGGIVQNHQNLFGQW